MKKTVLLALLLYISQAICLAGQKAPAGVADNPERHEFVISNFKTESGVTLPQAHVVYGTYGRLNAAKNNAVAASVTLHGQLSRL